jgi:hypothetical protein
MITDEIKVLIKKIELYPGRLSISLKVILLVWSEMNF